MGTSTELLKPPPAEEHRWRGYPPREAAMSTKNKRKAPPSTLYADVRRLLKKYDCPLPLHQIRAQFMGAIASPIDTVNPSREIQTLWGGHAPSFASMAAANEFMQVMVMGLWNHVAMHFGSNEPFALIANTPEPTEKGIKDHAKVRFEEIQGFLAGFFQGEESVHLSEDIADCLDVLEDLILMFGGIARLPKERRVVTQKEIHDLISQLAELTAIAQREINQIITTSAAQRRGEDVDPPRLH
jgi:hypothetical protein